MKRKGFTLIELLAVILILGIIALIAVPAVTKIIDNAKKGAAKTSALNYVKAINNQVMLNSMTGNNIISDGTYTPAELEAKGVEMKGTMPDSATITITNGEVSNCSIVYNGFEVAFDGTNYTVYKLGNFKRYTNGEVVYFNPESNTKCDASSAVSTTGTKTGCMKWYAFNDEGASTVNLLLDHTTTPAVDRTNPSVAADTATWDSSLNPRIISADEIAKIAGVTNWSSATATCNLGPNGSDFGGFYLDTKTYVEPASYSTTYGWLLDNTGNCSLYGCASEDNNGYKLDPNDSIPSVSIGGIMTSSKVKNSNDSEYWWLAHNLVSSALSGEAITVLGVKPVITVSKSLLD